MKRTCRCVLKMTPRSAQCPWRTPSAPRTAPVPGRRHRADRRHHHPRRRVFVARRSTSRRSARPPAPPSCPTPPAPDRIGIDRVDDEDEYVTATRAGAASQDGGARDRREESHWRCTREHAAACHISLPATACPPPTSTLTPPSASAAPAPRRTAPARSPSRTESAHARAVEARPAGAPDRMRLQRRPAAEAPRRASTARVRGFDVGASTERASGGRRERTSRHQESASCTTFHSARLPR